ncbi:hypothetical protein TWF281_004262 [Arthrobotrys megalospora]
MQPQIENVLRCWLYDNFYQHVPQGQQPKVKDLIREAKNAKRPNRIVGVGFPVIEKMIRDDLEKKKYHNPPTPGDLLVEQLFPHWKFWHRIGPPPAPPVVPKNSAILPVIKSPQVQARHPNTLSEIALSTHRPQTQVPDIPTIDPASSMNNTGKTSGSRRMKAHTFRQTAYNARAIAIKSEAAGEPPLQYRTQTEEGWRISTKNLIKISADMFNWPSVNDAAVQTSTEPIISAAPLFTSDIIRVDPSIDNAPENSLQFAIFAKLHSYRDNSGADYQYEEELEDDMVFLNTNTPFTTFICGLQGSGKSHSLSVIMENCVIQNPGVGILNRPLAGVVFYFSPFTPLDAGKPCEVAYLAVPSATQTTSSPAHQSRARKVTVLVSRSNLSNMKQVYEKIPGVTVYPLLLKASQLTAKTMLHLMSVQEDNTALYLQVVTRILRDMAADGGFNYEKFKAQLSLEPFSATQWALLDLRLELLESFLGAEENPNPFDASEGSITIVDLTCPFVDSETACVLFSICLDLFCSTPTTTGKIVALDEAHKFMSQTASSQQFANSVIQNIRLQRHLGLRTVISTQDPHVHPELLELSSFIIMHRFDSPRWFSTLRKHVGFHNITETGNSTEDRETNEQAASAFEQIMSLNAGQALVYCPRLMTVDYRAGLEKVVRLGNKLIMMQVRKRLTFDGGVTKTAV